MENVNPSFSSCLLAWFNTWTPSPAAAAAAAAAAANVVKK